MALDNTGPRRLRKLESYAASGRLPCRQRGPIDSLFGKSKALRFLCTMFGRAFDGGSGFLLGAALGPGRRKD